MSDLSIGVGFRMGMAETVVLNSYIFLAALPHAFGKSGSFTHNMVSATSNLNFASFLPALPRDI